MQNCLMIIKMFFINICSNYTMIKINNYRNITLLQKCLLLMMDILFAVVYLILRQRLEILIAFIFCYFLYSLAISLTVNTNILHGLVSNIISVSFSLIAMFVSTIINFIIYKLMFFDITIETIIEYVTIGIIQFLLIYLFFKIERFKYGFSFLQGKETMNKENTSKIGILVSSIIIAISLVLSTYSRTTSKILIAILILGGILMIYWIKKSITKYYKEKMKERTVEIQQEQIKQQDEKIKNLQTELADVLQINHKYSHRISAMEKAVTKLGTKLQANEEFAEEYEDILSSIKKLSKEYKEEVASVIKETKLPKTNIFSIDNLLEYMKQESEKDKIDFELNLDFDVSEILETKIPQSKLETMIADHIRDAIIAINCSDNKKRKIKVVLDKEDNNY